MIKILNVEFENNATEQADDWSVVPNRWMQDHRLSFTARGILAEMLANDWCADVQWMLKVAEEHGGDEERWDVVRAVFFLVEYGYIVQVPDEMLLFRLAPAREQEVVGGDAV